MPWGGEFSQMQIKKPFTEADSWALLSLSKRGAIVTRRGETAGSTPAMGGSGLPAVAVRLSDYRTSRR